MFITEYSTRKYTLTPLQQTIDTTNTILIRPYHTIIGSIATPVIIYIRPLPKVHTLTGLEGTDRENRSRLPDGRNGVLVADRL